MSEKGKKEKMQKMDMMPEMDKGMDRQMSLEEMRKRMGGTKGKTLRDV